MGIGAYRHRVSLLHPNGPVLPVEWFCSMQSAATQVIDGQAAFFVRGRYHGGITIETQLVFEGRTFQVQGVTDVDEQHREIQLLCVEVVGRSGGADVVPGVAPTITVPPVSSSIDAGESVTLTVEAEGTAPLAYQWTKNGVNLAGADNAFYVTGPLTATTAYAVRVSNVYGSVLSPVATVTVALAYQDQILADGASHYWPLDDYGGSATARDLAGAAPGTISGGVTLGAEGAGGAMAMTFDGTSGTIATTAPVHLVPPFTIEGWLRTTQGGLMAVFGSQVIPPYSEDGFVMEIRNGFQGGNLLNAGATLLSVFASATTTVNDGQWHYVVWVFPGGSSVKAYADAAVQFVGNEPTLTFTPVGNTQRPVEVAHSVWLGEFFGGQLQDLAIYPRALTPAEIAAHYALRMAA